MYEKDRDIPYTEETKTANHGMREQLEIVIRLLQELNRVADRLEMLLSERI